MELRTDSSGTTNNTKRFMPPHNLTLKLGAHAKKNMNISNTNNNYHISHITQLLSSPQKNVGFFREDGKKGLNQGR